MPFVARTDLKHAIGEGQNPGKYTAHTARYTTLRCRLAWLAPKSISASYRSLCLGDVMNPSIGRSPGGVFICEPSRFLGRRYAPTSRVDTPTAIPRGGHSISTRKRVNCISNILELPQRGLPSVYIDGFCNVTCHCAVGREQLARTQAPYCHNFRIPRGVKLR